jgi:hypothetical protein
VNLLGGELSSGEVSVLSAQVAGLARLRLAGVAGRSLAALVGVQVGTGGAAVATHDWLLVEVVHEGAAGCRETSELNGELDTYAILAGDGRDGATGAACHVRNGCDVASSRWVGADLGRRNDSGRLSADDGRRSEDGEDRGTHIDGGRRFGGE